MSVRIFCSLLLLAGAMAPELRAEEGIEDLAKLVSKASPDGRFRVVWWDDTAAGNRIADLKVEEPKRERVLWKGPDKAGESLGGIYDQVSAVWSPGGTRLALVLSEMRSQWTEILEWKEGKFVEKPIEFPDPPLKKDLGPYFYPRFDTVKLERWTDEDTAALIYSGKVQLREETNPQVFKAEWVVYEYRATLSLKDGKVTFSEEGKKLEKVAGE